MNDYVIEYLILPNGKAPIIEWLNSLDCITRKRINQRRILRIEDENFEDFTFIIFQENCSKIGFSPLSIFHIIPYKKFF